MMVKWRHKQPLKKKSAWLMILSTIGNTLCLLNIAVCMIFFYMFRGSQKRCFYQMYLDDPTNWTYIKSEKCFSDWLSSNWFMSIFADVNGLMIMSISEPLALVPYVLRSFRIKKLFSESEKFINSDKIQKKEIWKWREMRIIKIFLIALGIYFAIGFSLTSIVYYTDLCKNVDFCTGLPTFNMVYLASNDKGIFDKDKLQAQTKF
jgi:hypothetical protein